MEFQCLYLLPNARVMQMFFASVQSRQQTTNPVFADTYLECSVVQAYWLYFVQHQGAV